MKKVKIICVSLILILLSGAGVMAVTTQRNDVKITLANGYEMTVLTSKTKVSSILAENNIILAKDEKVTPALNEDLKEGQTITIKNKSVQEVQVAKISEEGSQVSVEELSKTYAPITIKLLVEKVVIPYETITKDVSKGAKETQNKVIKKGENGLKEVTYKIKYQNGAQISKVAISEKIIKKPVNKIVQVKKTSAVTSRGALMSRTGEKCDVSGKKVGVYKITGYCGCSRCCGKATGRTASGTRATAGRTVAASSGLPFGTKVKINGHVYTVEDRGGAIRGKKIDIYFSSHSQALAWGVRYMPVEVIK